MRARTYWHLDGQKRRPSDYEIATSRLLYYPGRGFEVDVPLKSWYEAHQRGSPLVCRDWERFEDPRRTTYASYVALQASREIYVQGLLDAADATGRDWALSHAGRALLERVLPPLRYLGHGLQMAAAYVAHMAPGGRIVAAGLFQTADEMRRVQRAAYRLRQIQLAHPTFGREGRAAWEKDPLWQPLRETVERLLATYDWGEAFCALNLVLKPAVDALFLVHLGRLARERGDEVLAPLFLSLHEDSLWQQAWSRALVRTALEDRPANGPILAAWAEKWRPAARRALEPFLALFEGSRAAPPQDVRAALEEISPPLTEAPHEKTGIAA